jgi:sarcosine oxidase
MPFYDVAIVGLGAMGSAALNAATCRGQRVIGFDRFKPGHSRSSSFGESRVIRLAYFEDPSYVPLLRGAYRAWRKLEAVTGEKILATTGIVEAGYPGAALVEGSIRSAREHDLPHELLTPRQVNDRFPAFNWPADWACVFQPDGGVLFPEKAIGSFVAAAQGLGATVRLNTPVLAVQPAGDGVKIKLEDGGVVDAGSAIVAPGPWIRDLVPELGSRLKLTRQPLLWFHPMDDALTRPDRMPVFFLQSHDHLTYGLPNVCGSGVKAASHLSGGELQSADAPRADASDEEKAALRAILQRYVPAAAGEVHRTSLCVYTRSPDEHFVIGPHPEAPQIVLASPCSGHGFKFASIIGEILAELAIDRRTDWPIDLFRPERVLSGAGL